MRLANFLRYIILPGLAAAVGVKVGIDYAKQHYVSKDRKFIEGKTISHD